MKINYTKSYHEALSQLRFLSQGRELQVVLPDNTENIEDWQSQMINAMGHPFFVFPVLKEKATIFAIKEVGQSADVRPSAVGYIKDDGIGHPSLTYLLGFRNARLNLTAADPFNAISAALMSVIPGLTTNGVNDMGPGMFERASEMYAQYMDQMQRHVVEEDELDEEEAYYEAMNDQDDADDELEQIESNQNNTVVSQTSSVEVMTPLEGCSHQFHYPGVGLIEWCKVPGCCASRYIR